MKLTDVSGIGPKSEDALLARGITSVQELAASTLADIEDIHGASEEWIWQAIELLESDNAAPLAEPEGIVFDEQADVYVGVDSETFTDAYLELPADEAKSLTIIAVLFDIADDLKLDAIVDTWNSGRARNKLELQDVVRGLINQELRRIGMEPLRELNVSG